MRVSGSVLLLLLLAAAAARCPLSRPDAPLIFAGRPEDMQRRAAVARVRFHLDRLLHGAAPSIPDIDFALRSHVARCRGFPHAQAALRPGRRYLVFAAPHRGRIVAVSKPLPYPRRGDTSCEDCAIAPTAKALRDERVQRDSKLRLRCRISGNPPPQIAWFRNGVRLKADGRIKLRSKRKYTYLVISQATSDDAGHYKCLVSNLLGNATASANVVVTDSATGSATWDFPREPCPKRNFCLNGGVCIYIAIVKEYVCECAEGYKGVRCENKAISTLSIDYLQEE